MRKIRHIGVKVLLFFAFFNGFLSVCTKNTRLRDCVFGPKLQSFVQKKSLFDISLSKKALPMGTSSAPMTQPFEQQSETSALAVETDVLFTKNFILLEKKRALTEKKRALVAECLNTNKKSKALAVKKTLFALESLILEDKMRDLAVEHITHRLKHKLWHKNKF